MVASLIYRLKRPFHFIKTGLLEALPAQLKYRFPARQLKIIALTGTDGKTTSSTLLYSVLKAAGKKVGLISTVAAYIGNERIDTGFHVTTPEPAQVIALMRQMVDKGYEYLILETTSHGIYQYRTWGIYPLIAGLTNISKEHLDYHLTYDNYVEAKTMLLKKAKTAVINADDESYSKVRKLLRDSKTTVIEYSKLDSVPADLLKAIKTRFAESYNHMNSRLVTAIARQLDIPKEAIIKGIAEFPGVPGRMERVPNTRGLEIIVDFAHTPQALEAALTALKQQLKQQNKNGKLIAIFGCAGLRDTRKRPEMGRIASELADTVIITAEDPRTENVWAIIDQIKAGVTTNHDRIISIADRQEAITFALHKVAQKGDIVGVFGKGHEKSMCFGTTEYPWDDVEGIKNALKRATK